MQLQRLGSVEQIRGLCDTGSCPAAYYTPIGGVSEAERRSLMRRFKDLGVADRVKFLSSETCSAQWVRSCDLVLQPFSEGEEEALLEAMAAGKQILSMADPTRAFEHQPADLWLAPEQILQSNRAEDYAQLACRLLADRAHSRAWGRTALARYDARLDPAPHVRHFERAVSACRERQSRAPGISLPGATTGR